MSHRLIFMGSDPIALPALEAIRLGECGSLEIVAVYTQPDRPKGRGKKIVPNEIKIWALSHGLPVRQPERMMKAQRLEIEQDRAAIILVMAYGHILSQKLIDTPSLGIWNLHTSILPKYRGASPIQCAVANGDLETGVSLMRMVKAMDAGPVLDIEKASIGRLDTAGEVEARLSRACRPLLARCLPLILNGLAEPQPQDASAATYVRKLRKDDGGLDFSAPAKQLASRINGLFPWPGSRVLYKDEAIKIGLADYDEASSGKAEGEILGPRGESLAIACGHGVLLLKRLQRAGGKMLNAEAFLRGFDMPTGDRLTACPMSELIADRPHAG